MTRAQRLGISILLALAFIALGALLANVSSLIRAGKARMPLPNLRMVSAGRVPADGFPVDSLRVIEALAAVRDPELDMSMVELGLVRRLTVDSVASVRVEMLPTTPECPYVQSLASDALNSLELIPGAGRIELLVDANRFWDPSLLTGKAREQYRRVFGHDPGTRR